MISTNTSYISHQNSTPIFSVVIPCYKVTEYLPKFLNSLSSQSFCHSEIELVFVVDGCPDGSEEIIDAWMNTTNYRCKLIIQENTGVAGARNQGLRHITGHWLASLDPDDEISPNYFQEVHNAISCYPNEVMFVTRLYRINQQGKHTRHPLDYKYAEDELRLVNLNNEPHMIHLHMGATVMKTSEVQNQKILYNEKLSQGFEDAHFINLFLLTQKNPQYVVVPKAKYFYKVREDSIIRLNSNSFEKYINLIENGYFELLDTVTTTPKWLSNLILYDIYWLFRACNSSLSPVFAMSQETQKLLEQKSRQLFQILGSENLRTFNVVNAPLYMRMMWEIGATGAVHNPAALERWFDPIRRLWKVTYYSPTAEPDVNVSYPGQTKISFTKTRELKFFGEVWGYEQILWFSATSLADIAKIQIISNDPKTIFENGGVVLTTDEERHSVDYPAPQQPPLEPSVYRKQSVQYSRRFKQFLKRIKFSLAYRVTKLLKLQSKYSDAWLLMDRDNVANDNAEALYRYLQQNRKDINSWFVLNRSSKDYKRLKQEGFKILPYGSIQHFLLMKNIDVLLSSHVDQYVIQPFPKKYLLKTWLFVFLQHGVTKDDVHRWLNPKNIDLFVTATQQEYDSFVVSPNTYKFSEKEVLLTGFPRHDRLFQLTQETKRDKKTVLIMPTWRNYLLQKRHTGGNERLPVENFLDTTFVKNWSNFLSDEFLTQLLKRDIEIILLPHPNIDSHWKDLKLAKGIQRISYYKDDIQKYIAKTDLVITDYSSQAFEGAFVGAPSVYFQFDSKEFFSGAHPVTPGYFSYAENGFGPIAATPSQLKKAITTMLDGSHSNYSQYLDRINNLYPYKDGKASQRIINATESLM